MEKAKDTNALWRNDCGAGVIVEPGDSIEVNSAYLNCNGAGDGATSISFDGKFIGKKTITGLYSNEDHKWTAVKSYDIYDNKTTIRICYFKNADGFNCFHLPHPELSTNWIKQTSTIVNPDAGLALHPYVPIQTTTFHEKATPEFVFADIIPHYKKLYNINS